LQSFETIFSLFSYAAIATSNNFHSYFLALSWQLLQTNFIVLSHLVMAFLSNQLLSTLLAHHGNSFKAIILFSCLTITIPSNHFWSALFVWQILILCEVFT